MSKKHTIFVMEDLVIGAIRDHINTCEADELARVAGEILGGTCYFDDDKEHYEFKPNENYYGALDE